MGRVFKPGQIVGGFEILYRVGSEYYGGGQRARYCVRCPVCGEEAVMNATYMSYRKDCGCVQRTNGDTARKEAHTSRRKPPQPWMDEGEIYRSWKESRDRELQYSVLAQLNGVPVTVIEEIVRRRKEADPSYQKTTAVT